jgi:myo-inositol catabolism protein IolS
MEYRKLGKTQLEVSRIAFGCWAIGGHGYGKVDDATSIKAIHMALDMGINFFDTADVYGLGHSEKILAKALGSKKNEVIIASKFGIKFDSHGNTIKDTSPKYIIQALENSLRRLGTDCIKLYQIHWHDGKTQLEDTMEALLKCRDAGKILYIGCCNFTKDLFHRTSQLDQVESHQCLYNLAKRQNESVIQYASEKNNISNLAYSVIGRGVYTSKYNIKSKFGNNDTRQTDSNFCGEEYRKNITIAETLAKIGKTYNKSPVQIAIRWVLENPFITSAITGIKNQMQVAENIDAVGWHLTQEDIRHIDSIIAQD